MDGTSRASLAVSSVAELARLSAWTVAGARGRWVTAERVVYADGRRWTIGLTPTSDGLTALMLWRGDEVRVHRRGSEAEMCVVALRWVSNLVAGRSWDADER
ncbi:hypothetical protein [Amycolatopsis sp. NPDC004378]